MQKQEDISRSQAQEHKPEVPEPEIGKLPRKRRRWRKRILITTSVLILLVVFAPWLLSTRAGTSLILSLVNRSIQGRADVDDLSLSWFGPIEMRGVRLLDPSNKEVLKVNRIVVEIGAWRAITQKERFQQVIVESPTLLLHEQRDGSFSFLEALRPKRVKRKPTKPMPAKPRPKRPRPEKPLPAPQGTISVRNGSVRVLRHSGQKLTFRNLRCTLAVDSLSHVTGELQVALEEGGVCSVEMRLRDLASRGKLGPSGASGTVKVRTPKEVELGPIVSLATGRTKATGRVKLNLDATLRPGKVALQFETGLQEFSLQQAAEKQVRPVSLDSKGKVDVEFGSFALKRVAGDLSLTGEGVQLATNLAYRKSQQRPPVVFDDVLAAVLEGKAVELPNLSLRASGQVDVARLGEAIPAVLKVRENLQLTSGKIHVDRLSVEGGTEPRVEGSLRLTDLSAVQTDRETNKRKTFQYKPITVDVDAKLVEKEGLQVQTARLESDFATLHGQGSPKKMDLRLNADLAQLPDMSGRVELTAEVRRADSIVSFEANGNASGLSVKTKESQFATEQLVFNSRGAYLPEQRKFNGDVELTSSDFLAILGGKAEKRDRLSVGSLQLEASIGRESPDSPIASVGKATLARSLLNKQPLAEKSIALSWSDLKFSAKDKSLAAAEFKVDGEELLRLSVTEATARFTEKPSVEGTFALSTDLSRLLAFLQPFADWEKPPAIAGSFSWNGRAATNEGLISATGTAMIDDLKVGSGQKVIRQGKVQLEHGAIVDLGNEILTLETLALASQPLSLNLSGKIEKLKTDRVLDLSGDYRGSWGHLMALLAELAPKLQSQTGLALAGTTESELRITGPANQPKVQPVFRGLATNNIRVDWASGQVVGFELGRPTSLQPMFADGQLLLEGISIPASGGTLNLSGAVNFVGDTPTFQMEAKTQLIDRVRITPEMGEMFLSRINPIFGQVASLDGELSLSLTDVSLPLGKQIVRASSGSGHLDISNLNLKPDGILANLVQLSGLLARTSTKVSFTGADFVMKDGKVSYENFAITFGKDFDLKFRGSVGFDDTLEMWVSVPVGAALLKGFGFRGPLDTYAKLLAKERARMEIPIRGTRLSPVLGEVKLGTALERITTGLLRQGVQVTTDVITLPIELLKRPDSLLKIPGAVIKKTTDVIKIPIDVITKPKQTLKDPGALFDRLNVTPQSIVIESLLEVIKKQQERSPGASRPKK